jgi:hypothetical protein
MAIAQLKDDSLQDSPQPLKDKWLQSQAASKIQNLNFPILKIPNK